MQFPRFHILPAVALSGMALLGSFLADSRAADTPRLLRVICWNIEWFPGMTRNPTPEQAAAHAELVKAEIKRLNPDILLAQEIGNWQAFADLVAVVPGLQPAVVSAFKSEETGDYWPQQLAIASRLPVFAAWSEEWSAGEAITPRRGFSAIAALVPDSDKILLFYSLHLKSNRSRSDADAQLNFDTRDESIRQILRHAQDMETVVFKDRIAGVVVGGDFNTNHDGQFGDNVIRMMEQGGFVSSWGDTPRKDRATWRGNDRFEATTFDYIFTKGLGNPKAKLLEVPEGRSDHRPFGIEIAFPSAAAPKN